MSKSILGYLGRLFSRRARLVLRLRWESMRDWVGVFALRRQLMRSRRTRPSLWLYFGFAPGDDLLCTAILRELRKRNRSGVTMVSDHRGLFIGNEDVGEVQPLWRRYFTDRSTAAICRRYTRIWGGAFLRPHYAPLERPDHSRPPSRHIIAELCASAGIAGPVAIRPYLNLAEDELRAAAWARDSVVIQSSGMGGRHPIRNKQWPEQRFQDVVEGLREELAFVQLGAATDPPLRHAKDLRSATSIRETAAILHHARLFVGTVGFLMHVARAVECPSVIIFGGREAPWQSGYVCNFNIYSAVPCAPCWRWNTCEFDRKCMSDIAASDVVSAIREMMRRPRGPLAVETVEIAL